MKNHGDRRCGLSNRAIVAAAVFVGVAALAVIYATYDPSAEIFPKCPVKALTGYSCPGCGSQRALHALLTGRPMEALGYNAMLPAGIVALAVFGVAESRAGRRRWPRFSSALRSRAAALSVAGGIVGWWVIRNVLSM